MSNGKVSPFKTFGDLPIIGQKKDVLDRFGRVIEQGDQILISTVTQPIFRVQSVKTVAPEHLPPNQPALVAVHVVAELLFHAVPNQPNGEFLRILSKEEADRLRGTHAAQSEQPATEQPAPTEEPAASAQGGGDPQ